MVGIPHAQPPQNLPLELIAAYLVISAIASPFAAACGGKSTLLASEKSINIVLIGEATVLPPLKLWGIFPCKALAHTVICWSAVVYWDEICVMSHRYVSAGPSQGFGLKNTIVRVHE